MSYQVLARKWRPRRFAEIVGQEHVVRALTNALDSGRLHHAYLFTGTRGVGKTTIARIFAKALNCETGVTSEPCGECGACREIDEGRFVDLIEVDAASKTKVDDTRELLDNVQFAPAGGRYKVYLIDEVHMLTKHSFNALLKTLEEPPPHVKFLLATTDPQKLLVTVLSRCLQFNLKRLTPTLIRDRLHFICDEEQVPAEPAALAMIARAADGSVRDGLSLLDQAIAYCGGEVKETATADMLGSIDRQHVLTLIRQLAAGDAAGLMATVAEIDERFPDYGQLLDDLGRSLQRIAVMQAVGADRDDDDIEVERFEEFARDIPAEALQLYYQIAITGRRDLAIAPDPRSGVEMTLLRMLAFQPAGTAFRVAPAPTATAPTSVQADGSDAAPSEREKKSAKAPASRSQPQAASQRPTGSAVEWNDPDWTTVVAGLEVRGAVKLLAGNCALSGRNGREVHLALDKAAESYLTRAREQALAEAISRYFGESLTVRVSIGQAAAETPLAAAARAEGEGLEAARRTLESDPNVKSLIDVFDATLNSDTVRVVDK